MHHLFAQARVVGYGNNSHSNNKLKYGTHFITKINIFSFIFTLGIYLFIFSFTFPFLHSVADHK